MLLPFKEINMSIEALLIDILYLVIVGLVVWLVFWVLDTYCGFLPGPIIMAIKAIIIILIVIAIVQFAFGVLPMPRAILK